MLLEEKYGSYQPVPPHRYTHLDWGIFSPESAEHHANQMNMEQNGQDL